MSKIYWRITCVLTFLCTAPTSKLQQNVLMDPGDSSQVATLFFYFSSRFLLKISAARSPRTSGADRIVVGKNSISM